MSTFPGVEYTRLRVGARRAAPALTATAALAYTALTAFLLAAAWVAVNSAGGVYLAQLPSGNAQGWIAGPLRNLAVESGGIGAGALSVTLVVMFAAYLLVLSLAQSLSARIAWAAIVLVTVLFCLAPLFFSSDVFGYLSYARLGALHGLNPYLTPPLAAPRDAVLPYVFWRHATTPYGPLFTLASYPLALLSPALALWLLKALAAAAAVGLAWVVSRVASQRGKDPVRAALFVGLNPLLLFYAVSGAHNDLLATLLVAAALALALGGRERRATVALVAAGAVKVTAGLALPFLLLAARARVRARSDALLAALAGFAVVAVITLLVFGPHVLDQLHRISSDPRFDTAYSGPDRLAALLGVGVTSSLRAACLAAAGAVALAALWWVWRDGRVWGRHGRDERDRPDGRDADWIAAAGWATLALIAAIASFAPWYVVWLLPLAALARGRALAGASLALTAYVLAVHLPLLGGVPWLHPPMG